MKDYTKTQKVVTLKGGTKMNNSFSQAPQLLLLEIWQSKTKTSSGAHFAMANPTPDDASNPTRDSFGKEAANNVAPGVDWPYDGQPYAQLQTEAQLAPILQWYFRHLESLHERGKYH